ncbi:MAG: DUF6485 family protein [candidate division WOR-3 bacterium]
MSRECQIIKNKRFCTCTYELCPRKARCCECVIYHRQNNEIPGCFFSRQAEKTYDRSIRNFIESYKKEHNLE